MGASIVGVIALVAGAGVAWGVWSFNRVKRVDVQLAKAGDEEPRNYLVIGSDSRANVNKNEPGSGVMLGSGAPEGRRADSIAVVRIDPKKERVDMLSIPRDLWLPISPSGKTQRINTAYAKSAQNVIDTIQKNLNVPINDYVEVDFQGFQDLITAIGGVPMYFDHPVRDKNSGLQIVKKGCARLDGFQGLAFARSRHLEWSNGSKWVSDPTGDIGRITRQQVLARAALTKVRGMGLGNITRLKGLLDAGLDNVKLDSTLGFSDILGLAQKFTNFDPNRLQTYALPVTPYKTSGGAAVVLMDQAAAQPALDIFRGTSTPTVTTTTVPPPSAGDVTVNVVNATPKQGEARRVSYVLSGGGFAAGQVTSGPAAATTSISYPAGGEAMGAMVASWLGPAPDLHEDKTLPPSTVRITIGSDFQHVSKPTAGSTSTAPATTARPTTGSTATASTAAGVTTTTPTGWTPGVAPAGVPCA